MKNALLSAVLCLFVITIPAVAQVQPPDQPQATPNKAHETVIDGRWEVKLATQDKPVALFEFKNTAGVVTGILTQDGKPTEIKNGTVKDTELKFETTEGPSGSAEAITMSWTGTIAADGKSIQLTSGRASAPGQTGGGGHTLKMEALRVE